MRDNRQCEVSRLLFHQRRRTSTTLGWRLLDESPIRANDWCLDEKSLRKRTTRRCCCLPCPVANGYQVVARVRPTWRGPLFLRSTDIWRCQESGTIPKCACHFPLSWLTRSLRRRERHEDTHRHACRRNPPAKPERPPWTHHLPWPAIWFSWA